MDNVVITEAVVYANLMYLLVYRLAVLFVGGLSIFFGYRLFTRALETSGVVKSQDGAEMEAGFGGGTLILRNAAPGIFFAAFGTLVVIIVLMGNPPSFTGKEYLDGGKKQNDVIVRGGDELALSAADAHTQAGKYVEELIRLEGQAVALDPDNGEYRDSLAGLYFITDRFDLAIEHQRKAAKLLPKKDVVQCRLAAYEHTK